MSTLPPPSPSLSGRRLPDALCLSWDGEGRSFRPLIPPTCAGEGGIFWRRKQSRIFKNVMMQSFLFQAINLQRGLPRKRRLQGKEKVEALLLGDLVVGLSPSGQGRDLLPPAGEVGELALVRQLGRASEFGGHLSIGEVEEVGSSDLVTGEVLMGLEEQSELGEGERREGGKEEGRRRKGKKGRKDGPCSWRG